MSASVDVAVDEWWRHERGLFTMKPIPTPKIEVTRHVRMPQTSQEVSMYALRWIANEVEFGCSTYTPETPSNQNNDHYEMMTIQHLLDEFIKWVNIEWSHSGKVSG